MQLSKVAARVAVTVALSLLDHAQRERKTPATFDRDVKSVIAALCAAGATHQSKECKVHGLGIWYYAAMSREVITSVVQSIEQMSFQDLPLWLAQQLGTFQDSFLGPLSSSPFSAQCDMVAQGYHYDAFQDVSTVLGVYSRVEIESSGGIRTRYKRVFEFLAAWLECARTGNVNCPEEPPYFNIFGRMPDALRTMMKEPQYFEAVGACVYISAVQCSDSRMFCSGIMTAEGQSQVKSMSAPPPGPNGGRQ